MLQEETIHFHKKVFTTREERMPIREGYGKGLLEAAEKRHPHSRTMRRFNRIH